MHAHGWGAFLPSRCSTLLPGSAGCLPCPTTQRVCRAVQVMVGVYGPRQSERRVGYSEQGRVNCDVKLASFASRQRGVFGQVRGGALGVGGHGCPAWSGCRCSLQLPGASSTQRRAMRPHGCPRLLPTQALLPRRAPRFTIPAFPPAPSTSPRQPNNHQAVGGGAGAERSAADGAGGSRRPGLLS